MPTVINVHDAKTHLSRILEDVAAGAEVAMARAGRPVARLVPIESAPKPKQLGLLKGRIRVADDFSGPLPIVGEHAARVLTLPPIHRDPFDRLLTNDAVLGRYGEIVTIV